MKIIRINHGEILDASGITDMTMVYSLDCVVYWGKYHTIYAAGIFDSECKTEEYVIFSSAKEQARERNTFNLTTNTKTATIIYKNEDKISRSETYYENY